MSITYIFLYAEHFTSKTRIANIAFIAYNLDGEELGLYMINWLFLPIKVCDTKDHNVTMIIGL